MQKIRIHLYLLQANTLETHREPLKMTELPEGPWKGHFGFLWTADKHKPRPCISLLVR